MRIGLIGVGQIARDRHIPYYKKDKLVALCDLNLEAMKGYSQNKYKDYREMLKKEDLDMVDICTPPFGHVEQSIDCLESGCHILVEKPFTFTLEDCDKVLKVAREVEKEVCVMHSSLFFPVMMEAKKHFHKLGDLESIRVLYNVSEQQHVFCNEWIAKMPAGALDEQMPHVAYILNEFIHPRRAQVFMSKVGEGVLPYDYYSIVLDGKDAVANVDIHYGRDWSFKIYLVGSEGKMFIDLLNQYCRISDLRENVSKRSILTDSLEEIEWRLVNLIFKGINFYKPYGHKYVIEQFLKHLNGNSPNPVTPADIREVVRITEMVTSQCQVD